MFWIEMETRLGKPNTHPRRGITLVFVVSVIVLFLLMGTAFVIISNDYYRSARKRSPKHIYPSDHKALLEQAFYDLARGPALTNTQSPLRGHSLLADMYGYGVTATVRTATADSSEHFIRLTLNSDGKSILDGASFAPPPVSGSLSGLLMGVVSGPARGMTARIVDHQVSGATHTYILLPSRLDSGFGVGSAAALVGSRIVINGRAFAGSGAGTFNPSNPRDAAALSLLALRPNRVGRTLGQMIGRTGTGGYLSAYNGTRFVANPFAPNECYDTFDFQNMFLAGIRPDGTLEAASFHRAGLVGTSGTPPTGSDFRAFTKGGDANNGIAVDNNNDGKDDGIWMDTGNPIETRADGTRVKPLVSYLVLDMDGRININAHGSLFRDSIDHGMLGEIDFLGGPSMPGLPRGQGYGPPEISMNALGISGSAVMESRYGIDRRPGQAGVRDVWSNYKLFGYPDDAYASLIPGTVDRHFGSTMDIHGRFAYGYSDKLNDTFPIGMPESSIAVSALDNEILDSPYEISFAENGTRGPMNRYDSLFSAGELESIFRQHDPDSRLLPERLLNLGLQSPSVIHSITTHSFEVPTTFDSLPAKLFRILEMSGASDAVANRELREMLPPEVFRGMPMDVNRAFGDGVDNNGNLVVDEMGESDSLNHPNGTSLPFDHDNDSHTVNDPDALFARVSFARHLYIVTLLTTEREIDTTGTWYDFNEDGVIDNDDRIDFRKMVAQWVSNVVDFRDRDSIMTPCEFDLNPWDGWDVDGSILTTEVIPDGQTPSQEMRYICWGVERPELLITETMATHNRATQDLADEDGADPGQISDGDLDFDSHLVPKPTVFFELYNPWVINDGNQYRPPELYDDNLDGVDLQKTSPDGSSPVWRMIVTATGENKLDPDRPENNPSSTAVNVIRRIYFARPGFQIDNGPEVYYPEEGIEAGVVDPGRFALIGTAGQQVDHGNGERYDTYFGRRLTEPGLSESEIQDKLENETRRISLDPNNGVVEVVQWDKDAMEMKKFKRALVNLPIGLNDGGWKRELGVSDPVNGYSGQTNDGGQAIDIEAIPDGYKFVDNATAPGTPMDFAFDEPIDRRIDSAHYDKYLQADGLVNDVVDGVRQPYRVAHLQRLANPLLAYDENTNPYLTIDTCAIDLFAYNGSEPNQDPNNMSPGVMRFGSHERRGSSDSDYGQTTSRDRLLFKSDLNGLQAPEVDGESFNRLDGHVFSWNFIETMGGVNAAYLESDPDSGKPFCALTWNNRPFVSQLELANVPHGSSYWLTRSFDMAASVADRDVYNPPSAEDSETSFVDREAKSYSSQYPHLLNFYADNSNGASRGLSLHRLFDFLEVPSRFVGTETYVNPNTFSNNSHSLSYGLAAPFDTISNYRYPGKININTVLDPSVWRGLMGVYRSEVSYPEWRASRQGSSLVTNFANPFRPSHSSNFVPPGVPALDPVECSLFRSEGNRPLFDFASQPDDQYNNTERAAYFRNDMRQRLGNLVTGRSSVFAVWITIGYFEVHADGSLKSGAVGAGVEAGAETGEVDRSRAFYMFDRSIPVAFEPGKNHNLDRAVLVKTIIE
ncbi:MAG: hypothetical protein ACI814_003198 [Mariniblastus sp.]|jgi:hypothetical protein